MKHFQLILLLIIISLTAAAQQNESGAWGGTATYFGDLNTNTSFKYTRPAAGGFYRYNYDSRLSVKFQASYGRVEGNDATSPNYYQREQNFNFFSDIYEGAVTGEFNFLDFNDGDPKHFFSPYLCTGFGVFSFDPKTIYQGNIYRLQPVGTEGQGLPEYPGNKPYALISTAWIVGGGFKLRISRYINIFAEASERRTHTDYLDDVGGAYPARQVMLNERGPLAADLSDPSIDHSVGQAGQMRGVAKNKDKYFFTELGFSINFISYKCPYQE